ncbi:MAG: hypothetical protein U1F11_03025 [Steroidobacteraceae bacterium]
MQSQSSAARRAAARVAHIAFALLLLLPAAAPAAGPPDRAALDAELRQILRLLPGRYAGTPAGETPPPRGELQHKIVRIDAPQFGSTVFYHQISRDGLDSTQPFQQKIYVVDRDPHRAFNRMRAFVLPMGPGPSNLERDPQALRQLDPARLMTFPEECAIRWSRGEQRGTWIAHVAHEQCSFDSPAFRQRVSPDMTYRLARDSFGIQEMFYGADGRELFPPAPMQRSRRVPP